MRKLAITLVATLPLVATAAAPATASLVPRHVAPLVAATGEPIPGRYIVTLRQDSSAATVASLVNAVTGRVFHNALNGFVAQLDADQLRLVRSLPDVEQVEQDGIVSLVPALGSGDARRAAPTRVGGRDAGKTSSCGLDRLDQRNLPLDGHYRTHATGAGVTAYVIDTGIDISDPDFGGRVRNVFDTHGGDGADCNGHGTHVAGTIGGARYGVAKHVQLRGVRVLDCEGSGRNSDVIAGIDWVAEHARKPAVANLSLGGNVSKAVDNAAEGLMRSGVFLAAAAGNGSKDACKVSPGRAENVLTVAASGKGDDAADFSNYGRCVEVYAPGVDIPSDWLHGGTKTLSGTSMATPHVTGVAALYKSRRGDAGQATITAWLQRHADRGVLHGTPHGTPNLLLNVGGL